MRLCIEFTVETQNQYPERPEGAELTARTEETVATITPELGNAG